VSVLINYIINILNIQKPTDDETISVMDQQMLIVGDLIRTKFGHLTIPEIKEALKMYVAREFPEIKVFRILDAISIGEILNTYTSFRNTALQNYSNKKQILLNAPTQPSDEQKKQIREEFLKTVFDEIKSTGFSGGSWSIYDELVESGKINVSDSDKKKLYKAELKRYEVEEKDLIMKKGYYSTKTLLADLKQKIENKRPLGVVQNRCKSVIVSSYLTDFVDDFEIFKKAIE